MTIRVILFYFSCVKPLDLRYFLLHGVQLCTDPSLGLRCYLEKEMLREFLGARRS